DRRVGRAWPEVEPVCQARHLVAMVRVRAEDAGDLHVADADEPLQVEAGDEPAAQQTDAERASRCGLCHPPPPSSYDVRRQNGARSRWRASSAGSKTGNWWPSGWGGRLSQPTARWTSGSV